MESTSLHILEKIPRISENSPSTVASSSVDEDAVEGVLTMDEDEAVEGVSAKDEDEAVEGDSITLNRLGLALGDLKGVSTFTFFDLPRLHLLLFSFTTAEFFFSTEISFGIVDKDTLHNNC